MKNEIPQVLKDDRLILLLTVIPNPKSILWKKIPYNL